MMVQLVIYLCNKSVYMYHANVSQVEQNGANFSFVAPSSGE